ncbi:MAG: DUF4974 domain-containing protein, partial [Verrucomicrobiota bacterium]
GNVLQVTGELFVDVVSDQWSEMALPGRGIFYGSIQVDGEVAFLGTPSEAGALLLRGKGTHKVTVEFTASIASQGGRSQFEIAVPPSGAALFEMELPLQVDVKSPQAHRIEKLPESTRVSLVPAPPLSVIGLTWQPAGEAMAGTAVLTQQSSILYSLDAEKVHAEFELKLDTKLGKLPSELVIPVPRGAQVLQVDGDEIAGWSVAEERIRVKLPARERNSTRLKVVVEMASLSGAASATVALPVLEIEGARHRMGDFSVVADSESVAVRGIATGSTVTPVRDAHAGHPGRVGQFAFDGLLPAPQISLARIEPRIDAELDTLVDFRRDAIVLERTATLQAKEGRFFDATFKLPPGEELVSVRNADGSEPEWRMESGNVVRLRWSNDAAGRTFQVVSRIEPKNWGDPEGIEFALGDPVIEGAKKVTGYIALKADPAFRLEAQPSETLEARDGRTTPVRGDYAWFRRDEFSLAVRVSKRPGEMLATLTGYALPLEGVLDLHAQMAFTFLHSGVRSVRIRVPEPIASNFQFEGAQIAERNLAGNIWTIVFQKELTGDYALAIHVQAPIAKDGPDTFRINVPLIEPLDAKRTSGVWAVEANTETEISFTVKGMNELDSLLAPALPGYKPRHRVIGLVGYLGSEYALALAGVRHRPAATLTSVVDQLELDTVVSTSGSERNQAVFHLRSAGAQFLDVTLPPGSKLWSLSVNEEVIKPVGDQAGMVRVQLPARLDPGAIAKVMLFYETPKPAWRSRGGYNVAAPRLSKEIPILKSRWQLFLPEEFQYTGFESNLPPPQTEPEQVLVSRMFDVISPGTFLRARKRAAATQVLSDLRMIDTEDSQTAIGGVPPQAAPEAAIPIPGLEPSPRDSDLDLALKNAASGEAAELQKPAAPSSADQRSKDLWSSITIPRLEFKETSLREALEFLRRKSVELDPAHRGVHFVLKDVLGQLDDLKVTINLTNVPLEIALSYVMQSVGMKYKMEGRNAVSIHPIGGVADSMISKEYMVPPVFVGSKLSATQDGSAVAGHFDAKEFLISQGIPFPPGASATYLRDSNRLVVRNTQENIDLFDITRTASQGEAPAMAQAGVAGLFPLRMELVRTGRPVLFEGLYEAQTVAFSYEDYWAGARRLWLWFIGGGLLFLLIGARRHPWWRTLWAVLILSFFPLCVTASATPICNALLGGWLIAFILNRIAVRFVFAPRKEAAFV